MKNIESSITIEAYLQSLSIDGGEPIEIPDTIQNVFQFSEWFIEKQIGNACQLNQARSRLQLMLGYTYIQPKSFEQLRKSQK